MDRVDTIDRELQYSLCMCVSVKSLLTSIQVHTTK